MAVRATPDRELSANQLKTRLLSARWEANATRFGTNRSGWHVAASWSLWVIHFLINNLGREFWFGTRRV
jgi:hypothetical protein